MTKDDDDQSTVDFMIPTMSLQDETISRHELDAYLGQPPDDDDNLGGQ